MSKIPGPIERAILHEIAMVEDMPWDEIGCMGHWGRYRQLEGCTEETPESIWIRKQKDQRIDQALSKLAPSELQVITLSYFMNDGLGQRTQAEIAEELEVSQQYINRLLLRAEAKLGNLLSDYVKELDG